MANFDNNRFKSRNQRWETPDNLFNYLNKEFNFEIDIAGDESNSKCDKYFRKDAFKKEWSGICWLNPPYGSKDHKLKDWVMKAYLESGKDDCIVVMLIPARTNTSWWHTYCMNAKEVRFINGRPRFKGCIYGLPQPLAIVVFDECSSKTEFSSLNLRDINEG